MKMKPPNFKKILFIALVLIILGGIVYLAYVNHKYFKRAMIDQAQQDLLSVAKSEAQSIARYIEDIHKELEVLSSGNIVQENILEKNDMNLHSEYFKSLGDYYKGLKALADRIYLVDVNGIVIYRDPFDADIVGTNISERKDIKEALATHKSYTSAVFKSITGDKVVANLYPVFKDGKFIGLLRAVVLLQRVDDLSKHINQGKETYSFVIDEKGDLLSYPDKKYIGKNIAAAINEKLPNFDLTQFKGIITRMTHAKEGTAAIGFLSGGVRPEISRTLMAFAPVDIGNNIWSICVAKDYEAISAAISANAKNNIIFALFALLVLLWPVILYFRSERQRYLYEISTTASNIINKQLHLEIQDHKSIEEELRKSVFKPKK